MRGHHAPMRRYHRHWPTYADASYGSNRPARFGFLRPLVALGIIAVMLYFVGSWLFGLFDFGAVQGASVRLVPEERGTVQVALDGGEWKRAEQEIKLFPGDQVQTAANAGAALTFFDGTFVRLADESAALIVESTEGENASAIELRLDRGSAWVAVPSPEAFTGTITRTIATPLLRADLTTRTEALVADRSLTVFDGDGPGAEVRVAGVRDPVLVGEGQVLVLPADPAAAEDLYAFRTPLDPRAMASPFLEESRAQYQSHWRTDTPAAAAPASDDDAETADVPSALPGDTLLSVTSPEDGEFIATATVAVKGMTAATVAAVRVNGYGAKLNDTTGAFDIELSLPGSEEVPITVEALDGNGTVVDERALTVRRSLTAPDPPHFLSPAKDGETYQTQRRKLTISGDAPESAVGIIVNDYRLQRFEPGDRAWTYLANLDLGNLKEGENLFTAVAIDAAGRKSEPAFMTIVIGGETEGVIAQSSTGALPPRSAAAEEPAPIDPATLPQNDPLAPGTISVTAPSAGNQHTAVGTDELEFLIEGTVPQGTQSVWVNDYRLQLFSSGKTYWNYIASTKLNTMKRGTNTYTIVARDSENRILDRFTYTIEFSPREE